MPKFLSKKFCEHFELSLKYFGSKVNILAKFADFGKFISEKLDYFLSIEGPCW